MSTVFIALGSNIDPERKLKQAVKALSTALGPLRCSAVYRTEPVGYAPQPDFLNAVCTVETTLAPEEVLSLLRSIEHSLGKDIPFRNGPRAIDMDLLLYDNLSLASADLTLPHPRMHERRFVLEPLCELLDAHLLHPVFHRPFGDFLKETLTQRCERTAISL